MLGNRCKGELQIGITRRLVRMPEAINQRRAQAQNTLLSGKILEYLTQSRGP